MATTYSRDEVYSATLAYFSGDTLATDVFLNKYALRDLNDNYYELTPFDMHKRMAKEFARIEALYPNAMSYEEILQLMADWSICPQGSPMAAVGNNFQVQSASNCFTLQSPFNAISGIFKTDQEFAQLSKRRAGVGVDISTLCPEGTPISNAARTSAGIGLWMEKYSETTRHIGQNGRRAATMLTVSVHHPDILTFINIKRDLKKVTGANVSIRLSDEFMLAVKNGTQYQLRFPVEEKIAPKQEKWIDAKIIWDAIVDSAWTMAEPGLLFWDNVINNSPADIYSESGFTSCTTNPCYKEDTLVVTKKGIFQIKDLVGKAVEIWNGTNWQLVDNFRVTAEDQPLLKITLHDGSEINATPYHNFLLEDGTKLMASELHEGMRLMPSNVPWNEVQGHSAAGAYAKGFTISDGCIDSNKQLPIIWLYPPKYCIAERLIKSLQEIPINREGRRSDAKEDLSFNRNEKRWGITGLRVRSELVQWGSSAKERLPLEVFTWDLQSKCDFIAGLFDGDGTANDTKNGFSYQIASIRREFLLDLQTLLKSIGVHSKLGLMKKEGTSDFNDGYGAYASKNCWRLTISQKASIIFAQQVQFSRLISFADKITAYKLKSNFNKIVKIEDAGIANKVYCCTVEGSNKLTIATGIIGLNCSELPLSPNDSCRLMALNLYKFTEQPFTPGAYFNYTKFASYAYKAQKLMDDLIDIELECIDKILAKIALDPEPAEIKAVELSLWQKIRHFCQLGRRTGLGILALGDALAACNIKYGSPESIAMTEEIYRTLAVSAYRATVDMAEERGAFAICDPAREELHPFLARIMAQDPALKEKWLRVGRRNIALLTTAPTGSLATQTQTTSGCESLFAMFFTRRRKINPTDTNAKVHFVDALGDSWEEYKVFHPKIKEWMRITGKTEAQINESPYAGATANEIDWIAAVDMQAVAQKWVCHSISRTINLPADVSKETVAKIYQRAWESGVKGITVYRDGCRSGVLITDENAKKEVQKVANERPTKIMPTSAPVRPPVLDCILYHAKVRGEPFVVIVGTLEGQPYEIFSGTNREIKFPKSGTKGQAVRTKRKQDENATYDFIWTENEAEKDIKCISDIANKLDNGIYGAFTRAISASLRHGVPLPYFIDQLKKDKHSDITSFSSAIARVLQKHYAPDVALEKKQKCTSCGSESLQVQEGCLICMNCGSSKCS